MKLHTKLLLAQLPLGGALVVVALLSVRTVGGLGAQVESVLTQNYRSVLAAQRMKESIERLDSAALFLVAGERAKGLAQAAEQRPAFEAELRVERANVTEDGEDAAARALEVAWKAYGAAFDRLAAAGATGAPLAPVYFAEMEPAFLEVKRHAEEILALNQDAMVRKSDRARSLAERMTQTLGAVSVAALVAGVLVSGSLTARLLRPLGLLGDAARRIARDELDARAVPIGRDEIAELAREFNEMAAHLAEYRRSTLGDLLAAQETSQAAIDSLPDPVVVLDVGGAATHVNSAAETLFAQLGLAPGRSPLDVSDAATHAALARVVEHVLSGRGPYVPKGFEEAVRVPADGGERSLLVRASPLRKAGEGVAGVTVVLQDVTRLRRFDELKNDLVSTVAHEFRTPLTSLHMAIHLCLDGAAGPLTEKQLDLLHAGRDDCERLQRIVDDLLDLARLQSGKLELSLAPASPDALLRAAVAAQEAEAAQRDVALEAQVVPSLEPVAADADRIALVLSNLVANALRFSPSPGVVTLRAGPADGAVRFEVADRGPGLAPEHRERVFERFFRVPGQVAPGAGLGLSLAKEIVEAHGGRIGVESEPGHGATFWFELPVVAVATR